MSKDTFVCRLCDHTCSSQELLIDHNQFHVKNEPGLLMQGTDEPGESTTCRLLNKSLTNVKQECSSLDLYVPSDDTSNQKYLNAANVELLIGHDQFHVKKEPELLIQETNAPNESTSSCSLNISLMDMKQEYNSPDLAVSSNSDDTSSQKYPKAALTTSSTSGGISTSVSVHESSSDLNQECNSPKIETLDPDEVVIRRLFNVCNEVEKSNAIVCNGKWVLICNKCGRKCPHEEDLAEHYRQHILRETVMYYDSYGHYLETQTLNRCDLCNLSFKHNRERREHYYQYHKYTLGFCNCDKKFLKHKHLLKHARLFHVEKLIKCEMCFKGFLRSRDLKTHYKIHFGENSREWYGQESKPGPCLKKKGLKCDGPTSPKSVNLKCDMCGKVFVRIKDLNKHYKSHKGGDNREWFTEPPKIEQKLHAAHKPFDLSDTLDQ